MLASLVLTTAQAREVFSIVDWKFYPAYEEPAVGGECDAEFDRDGEAAFQLARHLLLESL